MTPLEQRIVATIARGRREGLEPKSIYLGPEDAAELGEPAEIGGLPVRRRAGRSQVFFRHGICKMVSGDRRPPRPPP